MADRSADHVGMAHDGHGGAAILQRDPIQKPDHAALHFDHHFSSWAARAAPEGVEPFPGIERRKALDGTVIPISNVYFPERRIGDRGDAAVFAEDCGGLDGASERTGENGSKVFALNQRGEPVGLPLPLQAERHARTLAESALGSGYGVADEESSHKFMIVYREDRRPLFPAQALAELCKMAGERASGPIPHETARELLIEFGRIESGVADALCPDYDMRSPLAAWREVSVMLGRNLYRSRRGLETLPVRNAMACLLETDFPEKVEASTPEGYAYYGLFPETYIDAAEHFYRETHPEHTVAIGIRSIGTSLSGAVAGTILELGGRVDTLTLRPRGHPFHREMRIAESIRSEWRANSGAFYLLVDEGPGLSGSSFASTAEAVSDAGVDDSRIAFFPAWNPDPAALCSEKARARWVRHARWTSELDLAQFRGWRDISAGKWRDLFYNSNEFPATHPAHERRKFVRGQTLAKFAGFGEHGTACLERAQMLHAAGFIPAPLELSHGFLIGQYVAGTPVAEISAELIRTMANYLAFLRREARSRRPIDWDGLSQMVCLNVQEAAGQDWSGPLLEMRAAIEGQPAYEIDGRLFPHEWIETRDGILKTDALDHHDDHFFPGPQDIAWDVAAATVEFGLNRGVFLELYARASGDRNIARRIPFYRIAYVAHRLAYSRLAASSLTGDEQARFRREVSRYSAELKKALVAVTGTRGCNFIQISE